MNTKYLTQASLIAAVYTVIILVLAILVPPLSWLNYGPVQMRVSEALTVLPYFTPAAIPGLFVGCVLSNIICFFNAQGGIPAIDIVAGSAATLLAAIASYALRRHKWLVPLPPIIVNAVILGFEFSFTYYKNIPWYINMANVAIGQTVACYVLGMALLVLLEKRKGIFK